MPLQDKTAEKMLNNIADFIAATQAKPDQRAWDQLLIYCPREAIERRALSFSQASRDSKSVSQP